MHVLLAFDKFKDALSARAAGACVAGALRRDRRRWTFDNCPLTDGGEGFAAILTHAAGGTLHRVRVAGPRGSPVTAAYGLVRLGRIPAPARTLLDLPGLPLTARIAIVEMAQASGLALLPGPGRDPWRTSTRGTGQLIRAAVAAGARGVLLGVGGSATHDLGLGALGVLGFKFRRTDGGVLRTVAPVHWPRLGRVTGAGRAGFPPLRIACDVTNPLLGPRGAARVYAPQKGLRPADCARLERETARVSALLCAHCARPAALRHEPGTGAAGGLAFGLMCGLGAGLLPGFELASAWLDLPARVAAADVVVTGEGRFDASSFNGKGPGSVARRAVALGKPVHVFAGQIAAQRPRPGLHLHPITPRGQALPAALRDSDRNLARTARRVFLFPLLPNSNSMPKPRSILLGLIIALALPAPVLCAAGSAPLITDDPGTSGNGHREIAGHSSLANDVA